MQAKKSFTLAVFNSLHSRFSDIGLFFTKPAIKNKNTVMIYPIKNGNKAGDKNFSMNTVNIALRTNFNNSAIYKRFTTALGVLFPRFQKNRAKINVGNSHATVPNKNDFTVAKFVKKQFVINVVAIIAKGGKDKRFR